MLSTGPNAFTEVCIRGRREYPRERNVTPGAEVTVMWAVSQGMQAAYRRWESQGNGFSPTASVRNSVLQMTLDSWPSELSDNKSVFVAPVVKNLSANAGDLRITGSTSGLGRSPAGGYSTPLQYSCLDNLMDRGAWWAVVHRVTKSRTRLKQLSTALFVVIFYSSNRKLICTPKS